MRSNVGVLLVLFGAACLPAEGAITYSSQARSVVAQADGVLSQSFSAPDFAAFNRTAAVSDPPNMRGSASATQSSSLEQGRVACSSRVEVFDSVLGSYATAASRLQTAFSVTEATPWRLAGSWGVSESNRQTGPGLPGARVTLLQDGTTLYTGGIEGIQPVLATGELAASGTLTPGPTYTLEILLTDRVGPATGLHSANATLDVTLTFFPAGASGACCTGVVCSATTEEACSGAFAGVGTTCTDGPGNPVACCPVNVDGQNGVDVADIFAFLSRWFAVAPAADFDANGSVAVADIFAFLSAWFVGC